jgi:hypothetical protein
VVDKVPGLFQDGIKLKVVIRAFQMRILLACALVFLSHSALAVSDEEFPARLRGFWTDTSEACNTLKTSGPESIYIDNKWLKISARNVLGTTQARLFREIPGGALTVEVQVLNDQGSMVTLSLSVDGRLHEKVSGDSGRELATYQRC